MTVQALYRRWRPRAFDEVVGQEHVVRTLRNALVSGHIHHAYLFAGPRGTGKTTTARLLAKAVNCLAPEDQRPCNECTICQAVNEGRLLDLIEIDAASNTGVDDVRELRERIGFRPNEARYKVYVIDEVHMLSNAAFNALLKTLEEPPPHAIFVLATTEVHKIPATVLSRCQRFDFRRIPVSDMVARLERLTGQEHIRADREALTLIARHATGSMRDAESLLDQLTSYSDSGIAVADVQVALGTGAGETILQVAGALARGDVAEGLGAINSAVDEGADPRQFARQMVEHLRALLLMRLGSDVTPVHVSEDLYVRLEEQAAAFSPRALARAVRLFNQAASEARGSWQPQLPLEMAFIEAVLGSAASASPDPETTAPETGAESPASRTPPAQGTPRTPPARRHSASAPAPARPGAVSAPLASPLAVPAPLRPRDEGGWVHPGHEQPAVREPEQHYDRPAAGKALLTPEVLRSRWPELLNALRPRNLSLEALMRSCEPVAVEGDVVLLGFAHSFHRSKVEEEANRRLVEEVLSAVMGQLCRVRCVLGQAPQATASPQRPPAEPGGGKAAPPVEMDPLVRTAVEDLGARIVQRSE